MIIRRSTNFTYFSYRNLVTFASHLVSKILLISYFHLLLPIFTHLSVTSFLFYFISAFISIQSFLLSSLSIYSFIVDRLTYLILVLRLRQLCTSRELEVHASYPDPRALLHFLVSGGYEAGRIMLLASSSKLFFHIFFFLE